MLHTGPNTIFQIFQETHLSLNFTEQNSIFQVG